METPSGSEDGFGEMPTRPMRVKVLYTFDAASKDNCLARFSETLQIPVAQIDETSHVGVIALYKCLQSIVTASPELINNTNDFAIYAYDYSEHETPLVGQGMLSTVISASTADTMITGRVCQNIPAIFSGGVKETLEVKLRLTPVLAKAETKSLDTQRTPTSAGFDPNAWNTRSMQNVEDMFNFDLATPVDDSDLMNEILGLGNTEDTFERPAFASTHSLPGSRAGSPIISNHAPRSKQVRHQSFSGNPTRPESRGSVRSEYQRRSPTFEEFQDEDGQARKRARITQTEWRGKSSFGGRASDLRVTAATTASMQMYRPVATRPGSNLEPPPRVPTPVPGQGPNRRSRPSMGGRSLLHQASFVSDMDQMSDAIASSPEDESPDGTPLDIPSSPPIFQGAPFADSGYMSERAGPLDSCSPEFQEPSRPFIKREESSMTEFSDANYDVDLPGAHYYRNEQRPVFSQMSSRAGSPLPNIAPAQSRGARLNNSTRRSSLVLPTLTDARPRLDSEAGSPVPDDGRPTGLRRSGSGAPRRKIIEQRLHTAVAKGEMPQYCSHCGAIETPTWRKLYVKYVDGKPSRLDSVEGEGETIGIEELEYDDETGDVTKFVIRKCMKKTKDMQPGKGFQDTEVCNSCGLWFAKLRQMRPQAKWGRKSGTRRSRKRSAGEATDTVEPQSEAFFTDAVDAEDGVQSNVSVEERQPLQRRSSNALDHMSRSSPPKPDGTEESPIELDEKTPKPTRRLLFPSPRKDGETKTLDNVSTSSPDDKPVSPTNITVYTMTDKENQPPFTTYPDTTIFKTPQKTLRRSPRTNKLVDADLESRKASGTKTAAHDYLTSPASSRYFLRSTPTRLAVTPGRSQDVSPFSRQLAEMLADDNTTAFSPSQGFAFSDMPISPGGPLDWDSLDQLMSGGFAELDNLQQ